MGVGDIGGGTRWFGWLQNRGWLQNWGGVTDGKVSEMIVQLIFFSCVTLTRMLISQCLDGAG